MGHMVQNSGSGNTLICQFHVDPSSHIAPRCEEPRLAYNRVAMTSYFQHRSASETGARLEKGIKLDPNVVLSTF